MKISKCVFLGVAIPMAFLTLVWAQEDRVGLPRDYEKSFKLYHVFNNEERAGLKEVWINSVGAKAEAGKPFPYGTVILMVGYRAKTQDGTPVKDEKGLYVRGELNRFDVMRKEKGYGEIYGASRSGEWEFNAYRANGQLISGDNTRCAKCHIGAASTDFVFTADKLGKK